MDTELQKIFNKLTAQNIEEVQSDEDNVKLISDALHEFESNQEIPDSNTNVLNKTVDLFVGYSFAL
ncbi:11597_t:CDS:2 [Gigaspora margarita]|uniref:11597_t:CDS:1 n=1 Tax=Gigaspora margarita TaxID=4874 RepID=A0ABN7ULJ5_GIGMA|nr:11597_t:CDS:2 [Gigaspora margarita]